MNLDGLTFQTIELAAGRLRYVEYGAGRPLLLTHGSYGSLTHWIANLDGLSQARRVIAVDLPGFGGSFPVPQTAALALFSGAVAELADRLGLDRLAIAGFSFGGLVAAELARSMPDRVSALVLASPPLPGPLPATVTEIQRETSRLAIAESLRASVAAMLERILLHRPERRDEEAIAVTIGNIQGTQFRARPLTAQSDLFAMLNEVRCPVLSLLGEQDPFHEALAENVGRIAATAARPTVRALPEAAHWLCYDQPDVVNGLILQFLGERVGA